MFRLKRRHSVKIRPLLCAPAIRMFVLEIVVRAFQDGATPETIVQRYSTLALPDVYAVLDYYLRHPNEIGDRREQKAKEVRQRIDSQQGDLSDIRARLLTQRRA
jgi:uncharacterized protein (DUF433 family)